MKKQYRFVTLLFLTCLAIFISVMQGDLIRKAEYTWIDEELNEEEDFRETKVSEETLMYVKEKKLAGLEVADLITKVYFYEKLTGKEFLKNDMGRFEEAQWFEPIMRDFATEYEILRESNQAIWGDLEYFPVAVSSKNEKMTVSYENSWKFERTYGGKRYHEGCDIMADINKRGVYPIVSISDGIVEKMGWLPKGGYRIGIRGEGGAYFYYAHLESYAEIEVGDRIRAGELLGYMGDSGYGEEGTVGKFAVHLHVGIYIQTRNNQELSVNPYPMLKYLEEKRISIDYDE